MLTFPLTPSEVGSSVIALAFVCAMLAQWYKQYIPEGAKFWVNLVVLASAIVLAYTALWIWKGMNAEVGFTAFVLGLSAGTLATWGYEFIKNLAAFVGHPEPGEK
jgi:hypothetical protein